MSAADAQGRPVVVVTGIGAITSLGSGKADNWAKLSKGESGIRQITRFDTRGLRTTIAGTVDPGAEAPLCTSDRSESLAQAAALEAISEAAIGNKGDFPGPLFMGVSPVEIEWPHRYALADACDKADISYDAMLAAASTGRFKTVYERCRTGSIGEHLAHRFGTKGIPILVTTACASGATAIQLGVEAIRRGEAKAALCVGAEGSVSQETVIRFSLLSALSTRNDPAEAAARPFSHDRDGFVMGEGAGALVIESLESATARGARILGAIAGCADTADPFHRTRPSPDGKAMIACMKRAITDAGIDSAQIGYINAHGTGTPENDRMEYVAMAAVFPDEAKLVPVSSTKSMIGHTLSAAGAIEAAFTLMMLQHQRVLPTINYVKSDPAIPLDVVPNGARDVALSLAMSNSFGFGGQNVSLIFSTAP